MEPFRVITRNRSVHFLLGRTMTSPLIPYKHCTSLVTALLLTACNPKDESHYAEISFPVFTECEQDIDTFQKVLTRGRPRNSLIVEKFEVPVASHRSLVGVARAMMWEDEFLRVSPEEYLKSAVTSIMWSCMSDLPLEIEIPGLDARLKRSAASEYYHSGKTYYAELNRDELRIYFNDGSYSYSDSMSSAR